jgi:alcohol dehydrogenase
MAAYREALSHAKGERFPRCVVIFGLGMLGLTACAVASVGGASVVVGADIDEARLVLAARFGATHPVRLPTDGVGLLAQVKELTAGRGADLALELSGSPMAAGFSLEVLRIGGTAIWLGAVLPTGSVPVNPEQVVRNCLTLKGVHNYAPPDLASAINFLDAHHTRFPFADLVSQTFPLSEIDIAFRNAAADRPVRVGVAP